MPRRTRHIWAERYDRGVEDIFDLQDEITETILGTIEPELGMAEQERARRKPPRQRRRMGTCICAANGIFIDSEPRTTRMPNAFIVKQ